MIYFCAVGLVLVIITQMAIIYNMKKFAIFMVDVISPQKDILSEYEITQIEKERSFDDRIQRIKDELAMQQTVKYTGGTGIVADEVDGVKNLPHGIIETVDGLVPLSREEIAE